MTIYNFNIYSYGLITSLDFYLNDLNVILQPYDLIVHSNYVIKDVFNNIVCNSKETLENDLLGLIK